MKQKSTSYQSHQTPKKIIATNGGFFTQRTDTLNLNIVEEKMRVHSNTMKIIKGSHLNVCLVEDEKIIFCMKVRVIFDKYGSLLIQEY